MERRHGRPFTAGRTGTRHRLPGPGPGAQRTRPRGPALIIDAHHHVWDLARTPWLSGPPVPRIFGDYQAIRRDYTLQEFAADAAPHGVDSSVYVQVNVARGEEVEEVERVTDAAAGTVWMRAIVSYADLAAPGVGDVLDRQLAAGPVRSVRQQLHWHENPAYRFAERADVMLDPAWRRGLREVATRGLAFELQVFPDQYADTLSLVDAFPDVRFVLLHAGMPQDRSSAGDRRWRDGLGRFAERHHVHVKLSALGTFLRRCDVASWRPVVQAALDAFGPERAMFGSNFPIEKLWTTYGELTRVFRACLDGYPPSDQAAVLADTARRFYRLPSAVRTPTVGGPA